MANQQAAFDDQVTISRAVAERIVNSLVAIGLASQVEASGSTLRVEPAVREEFDALVEVLQTRLRAASGINGRVTSGTSPRYLRLVQSGVEISS